MRMAAVLIVLVGLSACAGGGAAVDQARNDHDLGVIDNAALALRSQVETGARDVDEVLRRAGTAAAVP